MRVNFNTQLYNQQILCCPKPKPSANISQQNSLNVVRIPCITFAGTKSKITAKPFIYGAESDLGAKAGGVSLVVTDLSNVCDGYEFTPYYGGRVIVEPNQEGTLLGKKYTLPNGKVANEQLYDFKRVEVLTRTKNGQTYPVFTHPDALYAAGGDVAKVPEGKIQWLEEVCKKNITTASGNEDAVIYRVLKDVNGKMEPTRRFYIFTQGTGAMSKAYGGGSFAYSSGSSVLGSANPYAINCKAFVEMLPDLADKGIVSKGIMFNDPQTAYACEYIARKVLKKDPFYSKLKAGYICHNPGAGYQEKASLESMFLNFANNSEIDEVYKSPVYKKIADKGDAIKNEFFKFFMPKLVDENGETSGLMMALRYRENGFLNYLGTVAPGAAESYCQGRGDADGVKGLMKKLFRAGKFQGILNGLSSKDIDPAKYPNLDYYHPDRLSALKLSAEEEKLQIPDKLKQLVFETFNPSDVGETKKYSKGATPEQIFSDVFNIKQRNAAKLFERINLFSSTGALHPEYVMGTKKENAKIWGASADGSSNYIRPDLINAAKDPNQKVDLFVAWGRADDQKGLDNSLDSFRRFVNESFQKYGDSADNPAKNAVLIMGGPIGESHLKDALRKQIQDALNDPNMKGRFVFLDAFAPNTVLASASTTTLVPSRWAPCELVDHETRRYCSLPIVTGIEGLDDKNFDAIYEADKNPTGFKTKHNDLTTIDEIKQELEYRDSIKTKSGTEKYFDERIKKLDSSIEKLTKPNEGTISKLEKELKPIQDKYIKAKAELESAESKFKSKSITKKELKAAQNAFTDAESDFKNIQLKLGKEKLLRDNTVNKRADMCSLKELILKKLENKSSPEELSNIEKQISEYQVKLSEIFDRSTTLSDKTKELLKDYELEVADFRKKQQRIYREKRFDVNGIIAGLPEADIEEQVELQLVKEMKKKSSSPIWLKRQAVIDSASKDDLVQIYKAATQLSSADRYMLMKNNWDMAIRWDNNSALQRLWKKVEGVWQWVKGKKSGKELYFDLCFNNPKTIKPSENLVEFSRERLVEAEKSVSEILKKAEISLPAVEDNIIPFVSGTSRRFKPERGLSFAEKYLTKQSALIAGGAVVVSALAYYLFSPKKENKETVVENKKHLSTYTA